VLEKLGMKQDAIRTTDQFGRDGKVVNEVVYRLNLAEL